MTQMNGAEALVRSLLASDVDVCFTNPGTSEMHFVAALDQVPGMRCVLALFEGVATGAADGYWRIARKPSSTLLHLGPGLANGLANLHNAKKAGSGVVNIVGEHAASHIELDAPLASDIAGVAAPMSHWVHTATAPETVGQDGANAVAVAASSGGQIATLILPGDVAWTDGGQVAERVMLAALPPPDPEAVIAAAQALGPETLLLLGRDALDGDTLALAGQVAAKTGCHLMAEWANGRMERGAGRVNIPRVPYPIDQALEVLKPYRRVVLCGAVAPIGFFAYPGKPARLTAPGAEILTLAHAQHNARAALEALVAETGSASAKAEVSSRSVIQAVSEAPLSAETLPPVLAAAIPENAIVVDESVTTGRLFAGATAQAAPHTWLSNCGGSIGYGLPASIGAAIAAPDRPVFALIGDGSAMYTPQALWTLAREDLDVTVVIWANHSYHILRGELTNVGVANPGPRAIDMLTLDRPKINWCDMARSMGVPAQQVSTTTELEHAFAAATSSKGPSLIEATVL